VGGICGLLNPRIGGEKPSAAETQAGMVLACFPGSAWWTPSAPSLGCPRNRVNFTSDRHSTANGISPLVEVRAVILRVMVSDQAEAVSLASTVNPAGACKNAKHHTSCRLVCSRRPSIGLDLKELFEAEGARVHTASTPFDARARL
jgi:hypothetical protein